MNLKIGGTGMNREFVHSLLNKVIKIDRGGPESRVGMVLGAENDYLILLTAEDGVVYYKLHHIKSITQDSQDTMALDIEIPEDFKFVKGVDFRDVLNKLRNAWVKINRGGPETLEGVLQEVTNDFATIVANKEVIRVSLFHIRNISYGLKLEKKKDDKKGEENNG